MNFFLPLWCSVKETKDGWWMLLSIWLSNTRKALMSCSFVMWCLQNSSTLADWGIQWGINYRWYIWCSITKLCMCVHVLYAKFMVLTCIVTNYICLFKQKKLFLCDSCTCSCYITWLNGLCTYFLKCLLPPLHVQMKHIERIFTCKQFIYLHLNRIHFINY